MVLNQSHSVTQSETFSFVAFIKGARETVVTTQAFCRNRIRDRGRESKAIGVLLLKVSILRPLSVSLERIEVASKALGQ